MFFMRRHVKAIVDNIEVIKRVIRHVSFTVVRSHDNDVKFVDCIGNIINCNLYDNYHHIANRKYNSFNNNDIDRVCFIDDDDVMRCQPTVMTNYGRADYQSAGYFQLRVELIKIVSDNIVNNRE